MADNYFVYDTEAEEEVSTKIRPLDAAVGLRFETVEAFLARRDITAESRVILFAEVEAIKEVIAHSFIYGYTVAFVAKKSQKSLRDTFDIPSDYAKALQIAQNGEAKQIDLLFCDDQVVLWSALVGDAPPHGSLSESLLEGSKASRIAAFVKSFTKIFKLRKSAVKLKTYKAQEIQTALSGMVVIEHDNRSCASNLLREYLQNSAGKLVALLISPASVIDYLSYLFRAIFGFSKTLPKAAGIVMSEGLEVEAQPPLAVYIDGVKRGMTPVRFEVHKKALTVAASEKFWQKETVRGGDDKEVIKISSLPVTKGEMDYATSHIPLFAHADTERYHELFTALREEARTSATFVVLMVLSTLLATVGLFLNSSSVVIGAMLLAPLMQPIVAYAMGLLRFDTDLFLNGLRSVIIGVMLVLATSMSLAYLLPFHDVTPEIAGRLHPTLLDLIVAIVSGVAAAYAKNNPKIIGSLAGVSIAVALVPPISTSGIGLGWGNLQIFQSAFLLFLTNFAGIVFAAALTFMVLGFSPVHRAKNGLILSLLVVVLISVPLTYTFSLMVKDANIKERLQTETFHIANLTVRIENLLIRHRSIDNTLFLRFDLVAERTFSANELAVLKREITKAITPWLKPEEKIVLEAAQRIRY